VSSILTVAMHQLDQLTTDNELLKMENEELRRTVDDLRRQLKSPPY
jgi:regulator of replication initiation timing